ncbi:MAG: OstA-like protein [Chitinophagaceae bacterium]
MKLNTVLIFLIAFLNVLLAKAQAPVTGPPLPIEILEGVGKFEYRKINTTTELQILSGNVRIRQGTALFYCDSCVINNNTKTFEAFGNVHINDSDTAHVYANYLRYLTDRRMAYLRGNVRLTDGHGTLTTNDLEYDMASRIGTYKNGGRVVNKKSVLTSKEGVYYADVRDVYFKKNVELKDPAYYLKTDSLLYNTETQVARFISETFIRDSSRRTIRTKEGYYDIRGGRAEFTQRTVIEDGSLRIMGDQIANDDVAGVVQIRGRGVLIDTAQGVNILANEIFANKKTDAYLATRNPLMIIKQEKDSIYVTADTLFSARLTDLFQTPDTTEKAKPGKRNNKLFKNDSTNRYFEAFRNVRIFSDSVQAVSDSLFYSFKDSTFRLFDNPVVWSRGSQITGDTIFLFTKNKKADRVNVFENSFLINELEPNVFNQVKATRMNGYFTGGAIDSVRAKGSAESIYFIRDDDSAYSGINQTTSDALDVYFKQGDLHKVIFRSAVKGTLWPISQKTPGEMRLKGFNWLESRRPKTKYELFE